MNTFEAAFLGKSEIWNPTESQGYRSWQKTVFGDTEQMQFRGEDKANLGAAFTSGHKSVRDGPKLPNFRFWGEAADAAATVAIETSGPSELGDARRTVK